MFDLGFQRVDQPLNLQAGKRAAPRGLLFEPLQGGVPAVDDQIGQRLGQPQDAGQGLLGRGQGSQSLRIERQADGRNQRAGQVPQVEQLFGQGPVVEAQDAGLEFGRILVGGQRLIEEPGVRRAQFVEQHQHADVAQQGCQKRLVAGELPDLFADLACRHGLRERVPPITVDASAGANFAQRLRHAETQHEQFQRLDAEQGQRLVQVAHFARQREQRTVDHSQHFGHQGRVVFDAGFERPQIDLWLGRQLQQLDRHRGQRVKLADAGDESIQCVR